MKKVSFKVYEDDYSSRQHKAPMGNGIEKWLNTLTKHHSDVEVVGFQHGQSIDRTSGMLGEQYYDPYETVYVIAKCTDNA